MASGTKELWHPRRPMLLRHRTQSCTLFVRHLEQTAVATDHRKIARSKTHRSSLQRQQNGRYLAGRSHGRAADHPSAEQHVERTERAKKELQSGRAVEQLPLE